MNLMPPPKRDKKSVTPQPQEARIEDKPPSELSEKETILTNHLEEITNELERCRVRVTELQNFNKWLEDEATKTRIESHEYMNYMGKKTNKRQMAIITLSDHNKEIIKNIKEEKKQMEEEYEEKKKDLETILLGKQHVLVKTKQQMNELNECKVLREEQFSKIQELEDEMVNTRNQHAKSIQALKENFLHDKEKFRLEAETKIRTLQQEANKEALRCLSEYTHNIQDENRVLRKQLLELLQKNHALLIHQKKLEKQQRELIQEQQYAVDLQKLRGRKLLNALKSEDPGCGHDYPGLAVSSLHSSS